MMKRYNYKTKTIKFTPCRKNISEYCKQELFLIVNNIEKYYLLRNNSNLINIIKNDFIYNDEQMDYLVKNLDLI